MKTNDLSELDALRRQGNTALAGLFSAYRDPLTRMVRFRLHRRIWGRVDPDDVLQEAFLRMSDRLPRYVENARVPVFVWMHAVTEQALIDIHRHHLGAQKRDASIEVSLHGNSNRRDSSLSAAADLVADWTSPSQAAIREESLSELRAAFDSMDAIDREVLTLRHFEELGNNEVARRLGLQPSGASNRYVRALRRLREIMFCAPAE